MFGKKRKKYKNPISYLMEMQYEDANLNASSYNFLKKYICYRNATAHQ